MPGIATVATLEGAGRAVNSISPARSRRLTRQGVEAARLRALSVPLPAAAELYEAVLKLGNSTDAYRAY